MAGLNLSSTMSTRYRYSVVLALCKLRIVNLCTNVLADDFSSKIKYGYESLWGEIWE
jgi:hypothetical protein